MGVMYTILVALDGSEHSLRAARYAARRAQGIPCKIHLLHVEKPAMAWEVGPVSSIETVSAARGAESGDALDAGARQFGPTTGVEKHAVTGEPAAAIVEQAAKLAADEIVIGSRGLRPLDAALLGSVAYKVLHDARIPVVVVH